MKDPLQSLVDSGTKLWLDSIEPSLVRKNFELGATGATSNPIIVSDVIQSGVCDERLRELATRGMGDSELAWALTDELVTDAQGVFEPVWRRSGGDDGYVSFELDPLLEDTDGPPHDERVARYVELGTRWSAGHRNRMIKIPATPAGLDAIEELVARGVTLNVTLIFSERQYRAARDAAWRGAQRRDDLSTFKSVYSIFVSRVDVYTAQHATGLSADAQGWVGIVNAKRIWRENRDFWADKGTTLTQEMIFASTGTKDPADEPDKYVAAFCGSDIETNPPGTNDWVSASGRSYVARIADLPPASILDDIDAHVDVRHLEETLMAEGLAKFAAPQKALLATIAERRKALAA